MKKHMIQRMLIAGLVLAGTTLLSGQSTLDSEVPGDNFSLEGALELFKKSASPEEFERKLNSPDSKVNNLDLNNDNYIDYIRVINRTDGNVHVFILQAVLSENESQDVAVIELEKLANGKAVLQITGDADVYGIETIIEPTEEVRVNAGATVERRVVNVWTWPSVQYVYSPYYVVYVSPWYWSYRPIWWSPWRPVAYYVYDPWWSPYRSYYSVCYTRRVAHAHYIYRPYRTTSVIVHRHYGHQIDSYRSRHNHGSNGRDRYAGQGRGRYDNTSPRQRYDNSQSPSQNSRNSNVERGRSSYSSQRDVNPRSWSNSNQRPVQSENSNIVKRGRPVDGNQTIREQTSTVRRNHNVNTGSQNRYDAITDRPTRENRQAAPQSNNQRSTRELTRTPNTSTREDHGRMRSQQNTQLPSQRSSSGSSYNSGSRNQGNSISRPSAPSRDRGNSDQRSGNGNSQSEKGKRGGK
jgi:hypothetical protein